MDIERYHHVATEIASKADIETLDTYEENISRYRDQNYTYIPMPQSEQYYNVEEGWLGSLKSEQIINKDTHLVEVLEKLENLPFLLVDSELVTYFVLPSDSEQPIHFSGALNWDREEARSKAESHLADEIEEDFELFHIDEFLEEHPEKMDIERYEPRYYIITLADLNKRPMKEMLYRLFAELAASISDRISNQYQNSEDLFDQVRPVVIGRWKKAKMEGINLHISENMNITDMKNVLMGSDNHFVKACGFKSKEDVKTLDSLSDIRNSVMHANRSLVHKRSDINDVLNAINDTERILSNMP